MAYRTMTPPYKDMDPVYDKKARCFICYKVIKDAKTAASVHMVDGGAILHPDDEEAYQAALKVDGDVEAGEMGAHLVGSECAKKLGEFVRRGIGS